MLATSKSSKCAVPLAAARASTGSIKAGRTTYLFEEVLEARRQQQRVLVLVQRLPERTCAGTCVASWLHQRK